MRDSVSDDKIACRKVIWILSTQTGLDTEMHYAHTQVPSTAAIESDEELLEDADPINSHYSKHNVDCRAKRVKAKVSKLQAEVKENKKKVQYAEEKLAQAQLDITEANTLCSQH